MRRALLGLAALLSTSAARADEPVKRRPAATIVAIVPGAVVHGAGHYVAGQPATARKLLIVEGVGAGSLVSAMTLIALTGASRRTVAPLATVAVAGFGLFAISFLSDVYGVLATPDSVGSPLRALPFVETRAGARFIHDPQFNAGVFATQGLDLRAGRFRVSANAWQAPAGGIARWETVAAARVVGPGTRVGARDGSFVDLEGGTTHRAFRLDGFSATTLEGRIAGRLDLARVAPTLRGSFAELHVGAAVAFYRYVGGAIEADDLLLARIAWGLYLGRGRGEAALFYDHRRDTLTGGVLIPGIGAGYLGFFGAEARYFLDDTWGVAADAQIGGAYAMGLSLIFRRGASSW